MKRKVSAILVISVILLSLLPMGIGSAAQGTLDYVDPTSAFLWVSGEANVDGSTTTNVIKFKVTDGDLNTATSLTGAHYLLGTAGASDTFAVDSTVQPVVAVSSVFDLQTGSSYIPSITSSIEEVATRFTSSDIVLNVTSDTDLTTDLLNTSRVKISVVDQTGTDTTGTTVTVTIKGTSVNPITLVETADATEAETITAATGATTTARTTTSFKAGTVTFQTSATTTGADGYTLALVETLTMDSSSVTVHTTRSEEIATRFTSADITANVTLDQDLTTDLSNTSRVKISVVDQTGTDATGTTVTVTIKGTSVNPITLAETQDVTEAETLTTSTGGTATARTDTFFKAGTVTFQTSATTTGADGYTLSLIETLTVAGTFTYSQMNDTDTGSGPTTYSQTVKATSLSDTVGVNLTLVETTSSTEALSKTSGVFQRVVANWSDWKSDKSATPVTATGIAVIGGVMRYNIVARQVAGSPNAHQFTSATNLAAVITALGTSDTNLTNVTATTVDETKVEAGATWVLNTAAALGLDIATATWGQLFSITVAATHAGMIILTYSDANGAVVVRTITVDLSNPVISDASPAGGSAINTTTPYFTATINEQGSGLDLGVADTVVVTVDGVVLNETVSDLGGGVYEILALTSALIAGAHAWSISTVDRVGNTGTTGAMAFTVDLSSPAVTSAATGIGLKLATGSTTSYVEFASSNWIRVTMSEKVTGADASDFDIAGTLAAEVLVQQNVTLLDGTTSTDLRTNVYVRSATALDPAATPKVSIVGAVTDLAGNAAPTGTATGASVTPVDRIKPSLSLGVSPTLGGSGTVVTITVTSDETLLGDAPLVRVAGLTVAATKTATNSWTASYTIASEGAFTASADASDFTGNAAIQKTATFQGDLTGPVMSFSTVDSDSSTPGVQLDTPSLFVQVAGNDADEYSGDTNTAVTISLAALDTLTALGGTVTGTATALAASDFVTTDSITFVYGVANLASGAYKLSVTGADAAGNVGTMATQEFEVVDRTDTWYLAEGYTGNGFSTYILIMNANSSAASVDVTYMLDSGTNVTKTHTVPANSRYTIVAGDADQAGSDQAFGTKLVSDQEIIVERAMYWTNGGHVTAGIQGGQQTWYLAEGYTGNGFSTYILIMNANSSAASVDVTYMLDSGTNVTKTHTVPANSRYTIVAGDADQAGSDQAFGTKLVSDQEIVVERAMYWTNGGHVTAGISG